MRGSKRSFTFESFDYLIRKAAKTNCFSVYETSLKCGIHGSSDSDWTRQEEKQSRNVGCCGKLDAYFKVINMSTNVAKVHAVGHEGRNPHSLSCSAREAEMSCCHCGRNLCSGCAKKCASCQDVFCSICSISNFEERYDRIFCWDCTAAFSSQPHNELPTLPDSLRRDYEMDIS